MSRDATSWRDEIALREASLADARREYEAGELSEEEFATIAARERAAIDDANETLARIDATTAPHDAIAAPTRRVRRARWLVVAAVCLTVVVAIVLYASLAPRQAGSSDTGSLSLSRAQHVQQLLVEAEADVANGNVVAALSAYNQILALDATNVTALTQSGWLEFSAGSSGHSAAIVTRGIRELEQAASLAPRQSAPHLYLGIVAASIAGNEAVAKRQFEIFLDLHPSRGQLAVARPFLRELHLAN